LRKLLDNLISGDSVRLSGMTYTAITQETHQQFQCVQFATSRLEASRSTS
jgi:hypothetical protein